jgi:hypothetical protein
VGGQTDGFMTYLLYLSLGLRNTLLSASNLHLVRRSIGSFFCDVDFNTILFLKALNVFSLLPDNS